jgi:signal transduction histidine kinase
LIINEQREGRIRIAVPIYQKNKTETVRAGDEIGIIVASIDIGSSKSSRLQGTLIGSIDPYTIAQNFISPIVSGKTGYAWLLNEDGIFLVHHEEEFAGHNAFEVRKERNPDLSYEAIEQIQRKMMAGEEGLGRYVSGWHRGEKGEIEKLAAYTPVHINGTVWSVAVCAPVGEVEEMVEETKRSGQVTLGFVILTLIIGGGSLHLVFYRWSHALEWQVAEQTKEQRETIRELVRAEERVEHLNSVLKAIRNVNQLIVVERDRDPLLRKTCDILIESRGYEAAWLGLLKDDETFATVVGSGFGEDVSSFCEHVMGGEPALCIKNALAQKDRLVVVNKSGVCGDCFIKSTCTGKDVAIIRVEHAGRYFGLLAILFAPDVAADDEEKGLLKEVAGDIAIGLHNIELEEERKQAEEQIRRHNEELEELVQARMARIQELERQQVESEKLTAAGRMAARIAHEINNPLAGIKNSFLLIKDAIHEDYPYYEYVGRIEKEIDRIAAIVRQMFDLYRPGQDVAHEFALGETLRDVVALLKSDSREREVILEVDSSDASLPVTLSEALVRQVLYNIIENAIETSPPGGVVRIAAAVAENVITLTISDQGSGIPEEVGSRIFEPFFTTKNGLTTGGLGLGLSVSKSIVESLGGSLDFEGAAGQGTVFRITLPFNRK